jgi:hypothetical protein
LGGLAPVARDGGGRKGVTQATVKRRNLNFKPRLEFGRGACFSVRLSSEAAFTLSLGPEWRNFGPARRFCQESAMFETPILDVVTVLVIAAVLWSIFR